MKKIEPRENIPVYSHSTELGKSHEIISEGNEDKIKSLYNDIENKPKILTLGECIKEGIVDTQTRLQELGDKKIPWSVFYAYRLLKYGYKIELFEKNNWNQWMGIHINNDCFHAVKMQWLTNFIRTTGLYSIPQAFYRSSSLYWFVHPGQFRYKCLLHTESFDEKFVVWDLDDILDGDQISFEEWWGMYAHHTDKSMFVVDQTNMLEVHVGEERAELYELCKKVFALFQGQKPILEGTCDEEIEDIFDIGTYEGHGIGFVGHVTFDDLKTIIDLTPETTHIQKNNFTLFNNYHK